MQVTCVLEPADFTAYNKYASHHGSWLSRASMPIIVFSVFAVVILIPVISRASKHQPFDWLPLALTLAASVSFGMLMFPLLQWFTRREQIKNPLFRFPQTIAIDADGLTWDHHHTKTLTRWEGVQSIEADERALYFVLDPNGVYIVPRRAFDLPSIADEFLKASRAYWKPGMAEVRSASWPPPPRVGT